MHQSVVDSDIKWDLIWIAPTSHPHCQSAVPMIADAREIIIMRALRRERRGTHRIFLRSFPPWQFPAVAPDYQSAGHRGQLGVVPNRLSLPIACTLVIQLMAMACMRRGKLYRHALRPLQCFHDLQKGVDNGLGGYMMHFPKSLLQIQSYNHCRLRNITLIARIKHLMVYCYNFQKGVAIV